MKPLQKLTTPFKRLAGMLKHPLQYFSQDPVPFIDGALTIIMLFIVTVLQKLAWQESPIQTVTFGAAVKTAALNTLMAWTGFFAIYYFIAILFKKKSNLPDLLSAAGSASLPLVITTLISTLSWWIGTAIGIAGIIPTWVMCQNIFGWIGLALSWPGGMGYCILRGKIGLSARWSWILVLLMLAIFFAAWFVPGL
jgi:hypothetical protein